MGLPKFFDRVSSRPEEILHHPISRVLESHTVSGTLGDRALAATTTDTDTVDHVALLGLVTKTASLVGARRTGSAVDNIELTELY